MQEWTAWLIGILGAMLILACAIVAIIMTVVLADSYTRDELPRCHEDQILEGFGFFERGHWSEYTCVTPLED